MISHLLSRRAGIIFRVLVAASGRSDFRPGQRQYLRASQMIGSFFLGGHSTLERSKTHFTQLLLTVINAGVGTSTTS